MFPPGQFCTPLCPVGLLWVSIALVDGPEQQSGLMEFPLGKTHGGEKSCPLCYWGKSCPLTWRAPKFPAGRVSPSSRC